MIAKTTLCLIVITSTCQTAIQFARGDDCCYCCQNTDHSYIMQSTWEISTFQGGSIILHLKTQKKHSAGTDKKVNIRIQKSYSNIRTEYEYSNIRTFVDILRIYQPIFKVFVALLTTFGMQKDDKLKFYKVISKKAVSKGWCKVSNAFTVYKQKSPDTD